MNFLKSIPSGESDKELLLSYQRYGDIQIAGQLYGRYMDMVYGVCLKYLQDSELAKDAVMHIFEELVTKLRKHEIENFKSWLHTVARNHCLMHLRSKKNVRTLEIQESHVQNGEELHLNGELQKEAELRKLECCLGSLVPEQKIAVELFFLQQKSYNEVAEVTGLEWNKVRSLIQNGKRNLKICMESKALTEIKMGTNNE
ncbi:MAG: sigma-70 family RNA polymerase sigma factor [Gemmatimonadaceae bacterium]|nr:sigma-70 family RNA polymerase sigma factor [Chitinophagaceae bacterium]